MTCEGRIPILRNIHVVCGEGEETGRAEAESRLRADTVLLIGNTGSEQAWGLKYLMRQRRLREKDQK